MHSPSHISPSTREKVYESSMEWRPRTERRKGFVGKPLRDEEQGSNTDQSTQVLLGVRATRFCALGQGCPLRSYRGDAEPHRRAYSGARPARHCPDGADHASTDRAVFSAPGRPRPRDTSGIPHPTLSSALRSPSGDHRPYPCRAVRCGARSPRRRPRCPPARSCDRQASPSAAGPHRPYESAPHPRRQRPSLSPLEDYREPHRAMG